MISRETAEHYQWGEGCDGWRLVSQPGLSVIQERMPPARGRAGANEPPPPKIREVRHYHQHARQFFFVLSGVATMELNGERQAIAAHQGIEIPPGTPHQIFNESDSEVEFLVIAQPTTAGDRVVVDR